MAGMNRLLSCNIVAAAIFGFVIMGIVSLGFIAFGAYEIASHDKIFFNDGLGEVLAVLGLYFTVPYLFILCTFIILACDFSCRCGGTRLTLSRSVVFVVLVLFALQQSVTNKYLTVLLGNWALLIVIFDVFVLVAFFYFKLSPEAGYCYTLLYATKMAMQWNDAHKTESEPVFGPNGVEAMLFLCIPIVQFPLYTSTLSEDPDENLVDIFVGHFNLFVSHLLHSLDAISMYLFAFTPPDGNATTVACPTPFRWLLLVLCLISFIANNASVLHLFYRRAGQSEAEIILLPKRMREASRGADSLTGVEDENASHHRRMFQYLLLMVFVCDAPFLAARFELWRRQYYKLDIFIAKNLKDMLDVCMLLMRTDKHRRQLQIEYEDE